ncbi:MAG: hypothetical protein AYK18_04990 [Theionarchaea archaeon DG-70]|nr:MAG: hypothetical protein AYK18_04990 [Theionarchaea archaeon DG-70]
MLDLSDVSIKEYNELCTSLVEEQKLKPTIVQWQCTKECNYHCIHCGSDSGKAAPDELHSREVLPVIDDLADLGCQMFFLTGGEPLLREDVFEILDHAKDAGISQTGFATNGYAVEEYKDEIARIECASIMVSIDGYGKKHDQIRGVPGAYERAVRAIDILKKDIGVPWVGTCTVFREENLPEIPKILTDLLQRNFDYYRLNSVVPEGRARGLSNPPSVIEKALRFALKKRKDEGIPLVMGENLGFLGPLDEEVRGQPFFCGSGIGTLTIMERGEIQGCNASDFVHVNEGNIREKNVKDIWWNGFHQFRTGIWDTLAEQCLECKYAVQCRGGCWKMRITNAQFCYLDIAEKIAEEML